MLKINNRARELTSSVGLDPILLQGAVTGFTTFSSFMSNGDETYYFLLYNGGYEIGIGTYNSNNTLSRDTVIYSSIINQKLDLPNGQKTIFCTIPGDYSITTQQDNTQNSIAVFNEKNIISGGPLKVLGSGVAYIRSVSGELYFENSSGNLIPLRFSNLQGDTIISGDFDFDISHSGVNTYIQLTNPCGPDFYCADIDYFNSGIMQEPFILGTTKQSRSDFIRLSSVSYSENDIFKIYSSNFDDLIQSSGNGISFGIDNVISNDSFTCGIFNGAVGKHSSSFGFRALVVGDDSTSYGNNCYLNGKGSLLIGNNIIVSGDNSLIIANGIKNDITGCLSNGYIHIDSSGLVNISAAFYSLSGLIAGGAMKKNCFTFVDDASIPKIVYRENDNYYYLNLIQDMNIDKTLIIPEGGPFNYVTSFEDSGLNLVYNGVQDITMYLYDLTKDTRVVQMGSGDIIFASGTQIPRNLNNYTRTKGRYSQALLSPYGGLDVIITGDLE